MFCGYLRKRRNRFGTLRRCITAARAKSTPRWGIDGAGHIAGQQDSALAVFSPSYPRNGGEQGLCIRMHRVLVKLLR